ncbi:MAG: hypothetical protein H0W89_04755 [Candidatus Levybacteria bacterium]|nr:hypothetical protein [Candidatus Levybacteria bacterium]
MQSFLGVAALIINIAGYIPYIRDIFRNKVKPHPVTWGVWTILTTIVAFNQVSNGGGYSSLFFISTALLVGFVFILSLRYGMGGASKIDRLCLCLAILLLVYWLTVQETRISTLLVVTIDGIAAVPTILKTYQHPETESYNQWSLAGIAGFLTILSVPRLDWVLLLYPVYVLIANSAIVIVKYIRDRKQRD